MARKPFTGPSQIEEHRIHNTIRIPQKPETFSDKNRSYDGSILVEAILSHRYILLAINKANLLALFNYSAIFL